MDHRVKRKFRTRQQMNFQNLEEEHFGTPLSSSRISKKTPIVPEPKRQEIKTRRIMREPVHTKRGITDIYKGWECEEVERVGGASAGYSDVYYYSPDGTKLKSGPKVQLYCTLQKFPIIYSKSFFNFSTIPLPTETIRAGSDSDEDETPEIAADFTTNVDGEAHYVTKKRIRAYCGKVKEPKKYEEAISSPQKELWLEAINEELGTSLIGSLMFLASRSRPDILYAVTYLSQFNVHVKCLKQVLQYVVNTEHLSLFLHVDASWATDLDSCKSFGGHILYLGGAPLSWGCKKQGSVAGSTMESEYIALVHAVKEIYWMSSLFEYYDLLGYVNVPTVFSDSMSSIQFMRNDLENTKTKHMRIKYCMARDWFIKGYFVIEKIPTSHNTADIFTKWLPGDRIRALCEYIFVEYRNCT
uniref:MBD domain-containing protein n=1 Tax=Strigamia maritima TaxID=126957 RepID=T1J9M3_STRMM